MSLKQLDTWLIVKTLTVWMVLLYIICTAAFLVLPRDTVDFLWKPMFHAFSPQITASYVLVGLVEAVVYTTLATWLLVALYNYFAKSKR